MKLFSMIFIFLLAATALSKVEFPPEREGVRIVIRKNLTSIRGCYQMALRSDPLLAGRVVAAWDIDAKGLPKNPTIQSTTLNNEEVQKCILEKIQTLRFAPSPNGLVSKVSFPFSFQNTQ